MLPKVQDRRWPDAPPKQAVLRLWQLNGLKAGSIAIYERILGIFFAYCAERRLPPISQLDSMGYHRFWRWYARRSIRSKDTEALRRVLRHPLRAYGWALVASGYSVPLWREKTIVPAWPSIVATYLNHAREQRGRTESGLMRDAAIIDRFLRHLKRRRRDWREIRLADIDRFLLGLTQRVAPLTVARVACALRSWLRFLHASGRMSYDLSPSVIAPVRPSHDRPPRAWPWPRVRKLLQAINPATAIGRRDRAQFLLMSAYGLGAAEVLQLRLDDIDWRGRRLHVVRRKTKTPIVLPLLPEVAHALANYIRKSRPKPSACREVFLSHAMPYGPFAASGVLRHRVRALARRAGIEAPILGTHLFRHSHATRQVALGTAMKTLGDILGHRDPETTSIYIRSAVQRLRRLALPVPR